MSNPAISSTLLVAALDLNLVQLLRSAINTADATTAAMAAGSGNHIAANSSAHAAQQTVVRSAGMRNSDSPAATFESSRTHYFHPRLNAIQPEVCDRPVMPVDGKPFIQPPWKVLPWPVAPRSCVSAYQQLIKNRLHRTDVSDVGRTLDLFI